MSQVKGLEKTRGRVAGCIDLAFAGTGVNITGNVCSEASQEEEAHV